MSLIRMSLSGAVMILVIVVIRALLLHKLPKRAFLFLWGVVLVRLMIPYTLPCSFSAYSLLAGIDAPEISQAVPAPSSGNPTLLPVTDITPGDPAAPLQPDLSQDSAVNGVSAFTPAPEAPPESGLPFDIGTAVWIAGMAACAVFFTVSYIKCRIRFRESLPVESPRIAEWLGEHKLRRRISVRRSDRIAAPLTYGILRPVILLPKNYEKIDPDDLSFVLAHEYVHIRRFDAVFKILLTAAVCVHWFNPLVWVMYVIANKDIEISCDEAVIKTLGETGKKNYAMTLIRLEEVKSGFTPLISSFGKNAIKERIVTIMKFKKTTVITALASALLVAGTATAFATSAKSPDNIPDNAASSDTVSTPASDTVSAPENDPAETTPVKTLRPTTAPKNKLDYYLEKYADYVTTTNPGGNCLVLSDYDENDNVVLYYIPIEVMSENALITKISVEDWLKQPHNSPLANMNVQFDPTGKYTAYPADLDTKVLAMEDGEVVYAKQGYNEGYGATVVLKHNGGIYTLYGHLELNHGINVKVGDTVKAGQCIGYVGISGKTDKCALGFICTDKMPDLQSDSSNANAPAEPSDDYDYMIPVEGGFLSGKYGGTGVIPDVETNTVDRSTLDYYLEKYADNVTLTLPGCKHMALPYYDENGNLVIYYIPMDCISDCEFLAKTENCPNYQSGSCGTVCRNRDCPIHGYNYSQPSAAQQNGAQQPAAQQSGTQQYGAQQYGAQQYGHHYESHHSGHHYGHGIC